jgi:uncharacterized protein (DUF488 family)
VALFTIGHSNHPIERFLALLAEHGIEVLVDVRSYPGSRFNPQFNRKRLEESLAEVGIEYRWMGRHLGGRGDVSVESPEFARDMDVVIALAAEWNVVITCSEAKPESCHRTSKLMAWVNRERPGVGAQHIVPLPEQGSQVVNAAEFEQGLAPKLLWWELDERGMHGRPTASGT